MTTPLPQPERHWYAPPTPPAPPRPDPVDYWANYTPPAPAPRPAEPSYPWWVYALVVLALPLIVCLLPFYWVIKAIAGAFYAFALPWYPHRIPDRYRNHGRWS